MKKLHANKVFQQILHGGTTLSDDDIVKKLNEIAGIINNKFKHLETFYNITINHKPLPTNNSDALKNTISTDTFLISPYGEIVPTTTVIEFATPSFVPIVTPVLHPSGFISAVPGVAVSPISSTDTIMDRCKIFQDHIKKYEDIKAYIINNYDTPDCDITMSKLYHKCLVLQSGKTASKDFTINSNLTTPITPISSTTVTTKEKKLEEIINETNKLNYA